MNCNKHLFGSSFFKILDASFYVTLTILPFDAKKVYVALLQTPNHYVRSAFQCSRRVATSQKEHATVLGTLKGGFHIMIWSRSQDASTKRDITFVAAVRKFDIRSPG